MRLTEPISHLSHADNSTIYTQKHEPNAFMPKMRCAIIFFLLLTSSLSLFSTPHIRYNIRYAKQRNEIIKGDTSSDRKLDIYLPKTMKPKAGYPVVLFIHGGGFMGGDKALRPSLTKIFGGLLTKGYAVISINYMLARKANKQAVAMHRAPIYQFDKNNKDSYSAVKIAAEDASLALKYLNQKAHSYSLNMSRLVVMGGSAGAMTSLYLTFVLKPKHASIKAVVNLWGEMEHPELIDNPCIPVLTIHGTADKTIDYQHGIDIQHRLEEIGSDSSRMIILHDRGHAQYDYVGHHLMKDIIEFLNKRSQ